MAEDTQAQGAMRALLAAGLTPEKIRFALEQRKKELDQRRTGLEAKLSAGKQKEASLRAEADQANAPMAYVDAVGNASHALSGDFLDALTGGGYRAARDMVLPADETQRIRDVESNFRNQAGSDLASNVVKATGFMNPEGVANRVASPVHSYVAPLAEKIAPNVIGRAAGNVASGALSAGALGAAEEGLHGGTPQQMLDRGTDAATVGGVMAGYLGLMGDALSSAGSATSRAIRDPRTVTGGYIDVLDRTKNYRQSPEFNDLKEGVPGISQQAMRKGGELGELQARKYADLNNQWQKGHEAIANRNEPIDVSAIHKAYRGMIKRFSNENVANPDVAAQVGVSKGNLSRATSNRIEPVEDIAGDVVGYRRVTKEGPGGEQVPVQDISPVATLDDLILEKQRIKDLAEFGTPKTKENAPFRNMYKTLVGAIKTVSPEMASVDEQFMKGAQKLEDSNAIIFNKESPNITTDSVQARRAAANNLRQGLGDTVAGGLRTDDLETIRQMGPEYAKAVDDVLAKVAHEGTRFGFSGVTPHAGKWLVSPLLQNVNGTKVRIVDPAARGVAAIGDVMSETAPQAGTATGLAVENPVVRARRMEREKDAERAAKLRAMGR